MPTAISQPALADLVGVKRAFLVGIDGVGMSGAARLLWARGVAVSGSDRAPGERSAALVGEGVAVSAGEDAAALPGDLDLLVRSAAVSLEQPQVRAALARGVRVVTYAQVVGALMAGTTGICVAGCHGKTTTTSLIASALMHAGRDPSFVVGGTLRGLGTGSRAGRGAHFVVESCEYDRSFHAHHPTVAVITNVDNDHLDYYGDLAAIEESFRVFAALLPAHGVLVVHEAHAHLFRRDPRLKARVETYGSTPEALWTAGEPRLSASPGAERMTFDVARDGDRRGVLEVPLLGRHNAENALAAAAALSAVGLTWHEISAALAAFAGVGRRLERVAERRGVLVLDDYGHHPAEIRAVVAALRSRYRGRRIVVAFQPHQASRTRALLSEFATALALADEAWLAPIYFARDSAADRASVSSEDLASAIGGCGGCAQALPSLPALIEHAAGAVRPGDVVVTMGAGNIDEVARGLAQRL